jgi:hypothetical protein
MSSPRLVVRTYAPLRRALLLAGAIACALLALFASFEWGRSSAGFDGRAARIERGELNDRIRGLERELKAQRIQLATHESDKVGQTRERTELSRTIGELQAEVARLTQDLAFYRGVVGERGQGEVVRIQQFRVLKGAAAGEFLLRLVLGRPLRGEDLVTGQVRITLEGATAATPVSLDLSAVGDVPGGALSFSYRYVETLEQRVTLPPGFTPARASIEVLPARKGVNPLRETFLWAVEN